MTPTAQAFARSLGATWAGDTATRPPVELDAAILFAPAGELVPVALGHVRKGGTVVCAGIHMSDIPSFPYELLWGERVVRSVANLTRADGEEFLALAPEIPVRDPRSRTCRSRRRTRRSGGSARATCEARSSSCRRAVYETRRRRPSARWSHGTLCVSPAARRSPRCSRYQS